MEPCVKRTSHCLNHPKMSRWILSVLLSATNTGRSHAQNALQNPWAYPCRALAGNGEGKQQDHAVTSASLNTMLTTACWVAELWGRVPLSAHRNSSAVTRKFFFFFCALYNGCLYSVLLFAWEEARWYQEENQYYMKENWLDDWPDPWAARCNFWALDARAQCFWSQK